MHSLRLIGIPGLPGISQGDSPGDFAGPGPCDRCDPCYHPACDTCDNINPYACAVAVDAVACSCPVMT